MPARLLMFLFLACAAGAVSGQGMVDSMRGRTPLDQETAPPPMQNQENKDVRRTRAFAMQPPTIPHKIDSYQIDLNVNACLGCHSRGRAPVTQAVAVSVSHYMDRDGNFLAEISPRRYWATISRPSRYFSLGFLVIGGFVAGVIFWGAFNTGMELTNTEAFCTGCHEMRDNVYAELRTTIHYTNRSGVRAICPDCHVPHNWTDKIARKMQASKEVWGKVFGTIDTREKFLDHRLELAQHEWARMKANNSLECRNCHGADYMDLTRQSPRAADMHARFLLTGERTCIDCHKGIAHRLPDMGMALRSP